MIGAFGTNIDAAKSHWLNNGYAEGRSLTSFNATNYLTKYSDLSAAFGNNETLALKHYIQNGYSEGRILLLLVQDLVLVLVLVQVLLLHHQQLYLI